MKLTWTMRVAVGAGFMVVLTILSVPAKSNEKAVAVYKQKCAMCHGPDGKAETPAAKAMKVPSFASPESKKLSDAQLAEIIEKGKGKMPKYGASMKSEEIKEMVAYIRTLEK